MGKFCNVAETPVNKAVRTMRSMLCAVASSRSQIIWDLTEGISTAQPQRLRGAAGRGAGFPAGSFTWYFGHSLAQVLLFTQVINVIGK
jgi:hypothetical protein